MSKTHIYFVSGMAANSKIFEYIQLPTELYQTHFIEWRIPLSKDESIQSYAQRMCEEIIHDNPVLIGVSFGGIMAQEMSKLISVKKVIIISSIKSNQELPKRLRFAQLTKVYKLFPARFIENLDSYINYFLGDYQKKKIEAYQKYMSVRNAKYLHWAVFTVLHWQQTSSLNGIIHIHGMQDGVFPIKHIKDCIEVKNGTHAMVLTKAKRISEIISNSLLP